MLLCMTVTVGVGTTVFGSRSLSVFGASFVWLLDECMFFCTDITNAIPTTTYQSTANAIAAEMLLIPSLANIITTAGAENKIIQTMIFLLLIIFYYYLTYDPPHHHYDFIVL